MGKRISNPLAKRATTLIELLIALAIFSLVGLGVYRGLANSLLVFGRIKTTATGINALILVENIAADLRNVFTDSVFTFKGETGKLTFFNHSLSGVALATGPKLPLRLQYFFCSDSGRVFRQVYSYGKKELLEEKIILSQVGRFHLGYYEAENGKKLLTEFNQAGRLPAAVKITFKTSDGQSYQTVVAVPLGGNEKLH